jgi:uncharacterized lipoprotein YajG
MKKTSLLVLSVLLVSILGGCAHTVVSPHQTPPIGLNVVGAYTQSLSVDLINGQPNTTPVLFYANFDANYNEWTKFFIDTYAEELSKRGVKISQDSPNKIKVKLSHFSVIQGFAKMRANMTVTLTSEDDKWTKSMDETDTSGWSMGRAFGSVIYHTIEKLLQDSEVISRMKTDKTDGK